MAESTLCGFFDMTKYRWVRLIALIGLILVVLSVCYVERKALLILGKPVFKPVVIGLVNTPEFWGTQLSPNANNQAKSIHSWITKYGRTIDKVRLGTIKNKSQKQLRNELESLLGVYTACTDDYVLSFQPLYSNTLYTLQDVQISLCSGQLTLSGLLATPTLAARPPPMIIAIHGTAAGPEVLFDGWQLDRSREYETKDYHGKMGSVLAKAGFAVFAPQLITDMHYKPIVGFNETRNAIDMRLTSLGFKLDGIELTMVMHALTGLSTDSRVSFDRESIGAYGVSLGGEIVFYLAALDERIKATVVSQYMEDRDEKLFGTLPSSNWRFPSGTYVYKQGFSKVFSDTIMLKLILPRGVFIEAGIKDGQRAESAINQFSQWREDFPAAVQSGTIRLEIGAGGHIAQLGESINWLKTQLIEPK
jgi:dienelactone hydrolase